VAAVGELVRRRHRDPHLPASAGVLPVTPLGAVLGDGLRGGAGQGVAAGLDVDRPRSPDAELCIRAGYVALRRIADFFNVRHNPDPHWPEEPISIDQREFD
jgi:hypothetical protein